MDKGKIVDLGKVFFKASALGYIGAFDDVEGKIRMVMVGPNGLKVAGEFMGTKSEAMESCAKEFLKIQP